MIHCIKIPYKNIYNRKDSLQNIKHSLQKVKDSLTPFFPMDYPRLITDYNCDDNDWLQKLYKSREHWCPAFSKDYFFGGILSSQRVKLTNHLISWRINTTNGLYEFYENFLDVVAEWRSRENGHDYDS